MKLKQVQREGEEDGQPLYTVTIEGATIQDVDRILDAMRATKGSPAKKERKKHQWTPEQLEKMRERARLARESHVKKSQLRSQDPAPVEDAKEKEEDEYVEQDYGDDDDGDDEQNPESEE